MGGARCSYRTCTVKSDKKTHMFHFPVFDKVRCHQWIANSQKLNFLDLKLSQLKNRVICEHHFSDDAFMNVMRGKLKNDAVPTEDGPFCTKIISLTDDRELPINVDDIENDYLTNMEKKAHFSVKYGDFLTNDVSEPITLSPNYKSNSIKLQNRDLITNSINRKYKLENTNKQTSSNSTVEKSVIHVKPTEKIAVKKPTSAVYHNKTLPNLTVMAIEFDELNLNNTGQSKQCGEELPVPEPKVNLTRVAPSNKLKSIPSGKKVQIISERQISEPVKIEGEMRPVSPSVLIKVPDKKKNPNITMNGTEIQTFYVDMEIPRIVESIQGFDNSGISSQPPVSTQICLNDTQPTTCVLNSLECQNVELYTDVRPMDNTISQANLDSNTLNQGSEQLADIQHYSMVPNLECVSTSSPSKHIFTLSTDVPKVSNNFMMHNIHVAPTDVQSVSRDIQPSTDLETLSCTLVNVENASNETKTMQNVSKTPKKTQNIINKKVSNLQSSLSTNRSLFKSKMPPEKLAAIAEKRKFNMKLRDIVHSYLNKLDEQPNARNLSAAMKKQLNDRKVGEHLSIGTDLPTNQESNIAYFATRLQRMEDTLLNKIDQNSQRINDLKRIIKPSSSKKSAFTQTYLSAESTKRLLYQQISQFLSPEANSLVYEELFINKLAILNTETSPRKRKRR